MTRDRRQLGDIAQVDLDRLELQRIQYETDLETATVNLRTSKILLLRPRYPSSQPLWKFSRWRVQSKSPGAGSSCLLTTRLDHHVSVTPGQFVDPFPLAALDCILVDQVLADAERDRARQDEIGRVLLGHAA